MSCNCVCVRGNKSDPGFGWSSLLVICVNIICFIYIYNLTQLCCPICINISILGHILPADPAVSLCQEWFLAAAELRSNYATAPGCGTRTASASLGCSSPGCLGKATIPLPALPAGQWEPRCRSALGAVCPSGSRSDRRAKEGEPAARAAGPLEVTALPGSLRRLAAPSLAWQCLTCPGWHIPPSHPCCTWMEPSPPCPSALPWGIVGVFSESQCDVFTG